MAGAGLPAIKAQVDTVLAQARRVLAGNSRKNVESRALAQYVVDILSETSKLSAQQPETPAAGELPAEVEVRRAVDGLTRWSSLFDTGVPEPGMAIDDNGEYVALEELRTALGLPKEEEHG